MPLAKLVDMVPPKPQCKTGSYSFSTPNLFGEFLTQPTNSIFSKNLNALPDSFSFFQPSCQMAAWAPLTLGQSFLFGPTSIAADAATSQPSDPKVGEEAEPISILPPG